MFPANITRDEATARAGLVTTDSYRVLFDLTGSSADLADPATQFQTTSTVTYEGLAGGTTHIDVIADRIVSANLDGAELDVTGFDGTRLPLEVTQGQHQLTISAVHRYSTSGEGLHRFVDPADDQVYLYTQFEPADARRAFACFDQPNLKATFEFTVLAPQKWTVVSNAAAIDPADVGDGIGRWGFTPTLRMSTYITAIVAGPYHRVTDTYHGTNGDIPLSLLCRQSMVDYLDAERLFATTKSGFEVFEKHFGIGYAFGTYDQAYVPEFNFGAMENAGCVTHRDEYLFRSRVTAAAYEQRDNTILHEQAHMWFGDLVTMNWWDDLWLNESFAEWASHFAQSEYVDPEAPWVTFGNARKTWAYRQDQLPSTHSIAADMVDLEAVEQNFDGITYAKGASALQQLVAYVGTEEFLAGVRDYFAAHAFGNTSFSDLLGALEKSSGRDLSDWAAQWLQVPGVSTLRAEFDTDDDGCFTSFAVRQSVPAHFPTYRDHRIAIGLWRLDGATMVRTQRVECDVHGELSEVAELVGVERPDLILLNDDDLTYAKIRLDERSLATLVGHLADIPSPLTRSVCWAAAWDMCRDGELPARDYIALVSASVARESDLSAVQRTLGQAWDALLLYAPAAERAELIAGLERTLAQLVKNAEPGSDHQHAFVRQLASIVQSKAGADVLVAWLNGEEVPSGLTVDTDLRWWLTQHLARLGRLDDAAIDAELSRDDTISGRQSAAAARAAQPTAEAKQAAWHRATREDVPNETHRRICGAFYQPGQDDLTKPYVSTYLDVVGEIADDVAPWPDRGLSITSSVVQGLFPRLLASSDTLHEITEWMGSRELPARIMRTLNECTDDMRRALHAQQAASSDVARFDADDTHEIPTVS